MTAQPVTPALKRRDSTIDIIRGYWIVSMTFGHIAYQTALSNLIHIPWVDGPSGFILMSGLVLGMVQPGRIARAGVRNAEVLLLKRARLLYIAHVSTVLLAFVAGFFALGVERFPRPEEHGGVVATVIQILLLRVNPEYIDILSLYVILLLLAACATPLLAAGRAWVVALVSVVLYVFALLFPTLTTLPLGNGELSNFNWGAWQLLFLSALIVGWHWKEKKLSTLLLTTRAFVLAAVVFWGTFGVAMVFLRLDLLDSLRPAAEAAFDKSNLGFGRLILAWAAFILLYFVLSKARERVTLGWLWPIETLGRRSLDSFMVLTVVTILIPAFAGHVILGRGTDLLAVATLLVMFGWVMARYGKGGAGRITRTKVERETTV